MKSTLPVCPCPWCKKTPKFFMCLDDETWLPHLKCVYGYCVVKPKSNYIPIRKTQKTSSNVICEKISLMIEEWNTNNPVSPYEGFQFDFEEVAKEEIERRNRKKKEERGRSMIV